MTELTPEDVYARIDRDVAGAQQRAAAATAFRREVDAMRGSATKDGVTATVDPTGALLDLELPQRLDYWSGPDLARAVLAATRAAHVDVSNKVEAAAGDAFGVGSPVAERMRAELDRRAEVLAANEGGAGRDASGVRR